jgi:exopolysaccharide biosynthesis WecB/TagA/CpsF family protein
MGLPVRSSWDELAQSGEREIAGGALGREPSARESFLRLAPKELDRLPAMDVFGVPVATCGSPALAAWFHEAAQTRGRFPRVLLFAGARSFLHAWHDGGHRARMAQADAVVGEGGGVLAYAWLASAPLDEKLDAAPTLHRIFESVDPARPIRVFLVGRDMSVLERAAAGIEERFPCVDVAGFADARPDACLSEDIGEKCVDVVLVGIGGGRDELWIEENVELLDAGLVVGVGQALDAFASPERRVTRATRPLPWFDALAFLLRAALYLALPSLRPAHAGGAPRALDARSALDG